MLWIHIKRSTATVLPIIIEDRMKETDANIDEYILQH